MITVNNLRLKPMNDDVPHIWKKLFGYKAPKRQKEPKSKTISHREYEVTLFDDEAKLIEDYNVKSKSKQMVLINKYKGEYVIFTRTITVYTDGHKKHNKHKIISK